MLTKKQLDEIKQHLENAQNPVFFFDNDVDGLTSFLILQRYIGRGKGIAIKSFPGLNETYFKRVRELNSDYIFVLDKPLVDQEFIDLANEAGIPLVHIDHHDVEKSNIENYYNGFNAGGENEPTAYLCYSATKRKEDEWLAVVGCIGDGFIPEFLEGFKKEYPDLVDFDYKEAYDVLYKTRIGKVSRIMDYALKDKTSNVVEMMKYLMKARNSYDVLEETSKTKSFLERYEYINGIIQKIVAKAEQEVDDEKKVLFFTYGGDMSLSQHIANELFYKYPNFTLAVGYNGGSMINFSLRSDKDVREITLRSIEEIESATGGGHEHATGAKISVDDLPKFKENFLKNLEDFSD